MDRILSFFEIVSGISMDKFGLAIGALVVIFIVASIVFYYQYKKSTSGEDRKDFDRLDKVEPTAGHYPSADPFAKQPEPVTPPSIVPPHPASAPIQPPPLTPVRRKPEPVQVPQAPQPPQMQQPPQRTEAAPRPAPKPEMPRASEESPQGAAGSAREGKTLDEILTQENARGLPFPDLFVDEVLKINFKHPVSGKKLMEPLEQLAPFKKIVNVGVYGFEDKQKQWFKPDAIGTFSSLVIFLPLASKQGFLSPLQLAEFNQIFDGIQRNFDGSSDVLDFPKLEKKAQKLGSMVDSFSAKISLVIHFAGPKTEEDFENTATTLGFKRIAPKQFEKVGELILTSDGKRIGNRKGSVIVEYFDAHNLAISLLAGISQPDKEPLKDFVHAANAFAAALQGTILAGNGVEVNNHMLKTVEKELEIFYQGMRDAGIEPGSSTAHRLLD